MQGFFKQTEPRESEPSRPRFVNPKTGMDQSWQRASNFAAPLDSPFGLIKHRNRGVVRGINARPDIARMLLAGAVTDEKIDEVIATALSVADDEAKANNGTAVHAALALCDTGNTWPEEFNKHVHGYVAELKRHGLRPVATEQRVLNTRLNATGTFDRIYVTEAGKYLIGDIKTGRVDYAHKFAVQCEVYAGADYLVHGNGAPGPSSNVEPMPWAVDQSTAVLVHVDPDTGATAVYAVPLQLARFGAALAEQVRAFQRMDVLLPYAGIPSGPLVDQLHREAALAPHVTPETAHARLTAPDVSDTTVSQPDQQGVSDTAVPEPAPHTPSVVGGVDLNEPGRAHAAETVVLYEAGTPEYEARFAELMNPKNDKATLQRLASDLGCRDLAHHRKWLAEWIIGAENALASGGAPAPSGPTAAKVAATVEKDVPAAESTPFLLKQIAEAPTVADIQRIHQNVVQRSGEQAWTDAMTEVARARAAELDEGDRQAALAEIHAATATHDLAAVWTRVTMDGALMTRWTDELDAAAKEQAAKIQNATPVNSNPWGTS